MSHSFGESKILKDSKGDPGSFGLGAHLAGSGNRDRKGFLGKDVFSGGEGEFGDLVMEAVNREVVDRIDPIRGDEIAIVRENFDFGVGLEIREILVSDGEWIPRDIRDRFPLGRALAALHVALCIFCLSRADCGDLKVIDPGFAQKPISFQVRCEDSSTSDDTNSNHVENLEARCRMPRRNRGTFPQRLSWGNLVAPSAMSARSEGKNEKDLFPERLRCRPRIDLP
jgi:hypothetical protein